MTWNSFQKAVQRSKETLVEQFEDYFTGLLIRFQRDSDATDESSENSAGARKSDSNRVRRDQGFRWRSNGWNARHNLALKIEIRHGKIRAENHFVI